MRSLIFEIISLHLSITSGANSPVPNWKYFCICRKNLKLRITPISVKFLLDHPTPQIKDFEEPFRHEVLKISRGRKINLDNKTRFG